MSNKNKPEKTYSFKEIIGTVPPEFIHKTWQFKFSNGSLRFEVETNGTLGEALIYVMDQKKFNLSELIDVKEIAK